MNSPNESTETVGFICSDHEMFKASIATASLWRPIMILENAHFSVHKNTTKYRIHVFQPQLAQG